MKFSNPVPIFVAHVEQEGSGKTVDSASLVLRDTGTPGPRKRVVSIRTEDGATYRFQRYGTDEYLAFYDRTNADGDQFQVNARLPAHVEAVREAIQNGEAEPWPDALERAVDGISRAVATDGGQQSTLPVNGRTPRLVGSMEVGHMRAEHDVYGGRDRQDGHLRHMGNTEPPTRGWLGNPHEMDEETVAERRRVIAAFLSRFVARVEQDDTFRQAVESLRGRRVACWCRGVSQDRTPENWCHLDVVAAWLDGDLSPVSAYLYGEDAEGGA